MEQPYPVPFPKRRKFYPSVIQNTVTAYDASTVQDALFHNTLWKGTPDLSKHSTPLNSAYPIHPFVESPSTTNTQSCVSFSSAQLLGTCVNNQSNAEKDDVSTESIAATTFGQDDEVFASEQLWTIGESDVVLDEKLEDAEEEIGNEEYKKEENKEGKEPQGDLILTPEEDVVYKVPEAVNVQLRPYQREGVKWLFHHWKEGKGCILGDDMGLGKTIQAVSFVIAILGLKKKLIWSTKPNIDKPSTFTPHTLPILVCAPASVLDNWKREVEIWSRLALRNISVVCYLGTNRKKLLPSIQASRSEVVLTSYETFRADFDILNEIDWNCAIFDEVHKIKDRKAKVTKCACRLRTMKRYGLTGTVMQNTFEELWTLLNFVQPGCVGTLKEFSEKFVKPIKTGQKRDVQIEELGRAKLATRRLNRAVKKVVLRRDQSTIKDLLPGKDDHVVFCKLTPIQLEIYQNVLRSDQYRALVAQQEPCDCMSGRKRGNCCSVSLASEGNPNIAIDWKKLLLPSIINLQKIAQHPLLLAPPKAKKLTDSDFYQRAKYFQKIAYGVKKDTIKQLISDKSDEMLSGKMCTLVELLKVWFQKQSKVLLFSSSTKMLNILQRMLDRHRYSYSRLDGTVEVTLRQPIIDQFNNTNYEQNFVLLISTRAGGLGLNITSANVVVVYDASWNVTQDKQAQDRAYRIGQTKHTDVYRFISAGTVEEMIYQRQIYKQQMANIGLHGVNERRYFNGVLGVKGEEGEIFGLLNLLKLTTEKVQSKEIIDRVHHEEELFKIEQSKLTQNPAPTPMNNIFDKSHDFNPKPNEIIDLDNLQSEKVEVVNSFLDPAIANALRMTGVVYAHNNMRVVGDNAIERVKGQRATYAYLEEEMRKEREGEFDEGITSMQPLQCSRLPPGSTVLNFDNYQPLSLMYKLPQIPLQVQQSSNFTLQSQNDVQCFSLNSDLQEINPATQKQNERILNHEEQRQRQLERKRHKLQSDELQANMQFTQPMQQAIAHIPEQQFVRQNQTVDELAQVPTDVCILDVDRQKQRERKRIREQEQQLQPQQQSQHQLSQTFQQPPLYQSQPLYHSQTQQSQQTQLYQSQPLYQSQTLQQPPLYQSQEIKYATGPHLQPQEEWQNKWQQDSFPVAPNNFNGFSFSFLGDNSQSTQTNTSRCNLLFHTDQITNSQNFNGQTMKNPQPWPLYDLEEDYY